MVSLKGVWVSYGCVNALHVLSYSWEARGKSWGHSPLAYLLIGLNVLEMHSSF